MVARYLHLIFLANLKIPHTQKAVANMAMNIRYMPHISFDLIRTRNISKHSKPYISLIFEAHIVKIERYCITSTRYLTPNLHP